jgi:hypothetical protein
MNLFINGLLNNNFAGTVVVGIYHSSNNTLLNWGSKYYDYTTTNTGN